MIVVDSSALVAIAGEEGEAEAFAIVLGQADAIWLSPVNYVETAMVLLSRGVVPNRARLDLWLSESGVALSESLPLSTLACDAFLKFGKGNHAARLNLGDCFAYALARHLDVPLLYKGDEFSKTDVRSALQPT